MNITPNIIRRIPFANLVPHITEGMQEVIAYDMAARAKAEGHIPRLPTLQPIQIKSIEKHINVTEAVLRRIRLGDSTIWKVCSNTKIERAAVERAVFDLLASGKIVRGHRTREKGAYRYSAVEAA